MTHSGQYLVDAFGLANEWALWRYANGWMDLEQDRALYVDDFGDSESLEVAQRLFPGLEVRFARRSDMHARPLL